VLPFGRLGRPHGIRGEIVLRPFNPRGTDAPSLRTPLVVTVGDRSMTLVAARPFREALLVRVEGIETRGQAAALTNLDLALPRQALPPLDAGEFYVEDLVGCAVHDQTGRLRGQVSKTFWNGAQDVLTVIDARGEELMIPVVSEFLRHVDLDVRRIIVDTHE